MRVENSQACNWYAQEAISQNWSSRALERQIGTLYYERLLSSKESQPVESKAKDKTDSLAIDLKDYLRGPYILDFLNLPSASVQESELDQALDVRHEGKKPVNLFKLIT